MKAAIEYLEKSIKRLEWDGVIKPLDNKKIKLLQSLHQAIAVLEAAEKMNKENALDTLAYFERHGGSDRIRSIPIRALLESLPDKSDKE